MPDFQSALPVKGHHMEVAGSSVGLRYGSNQADNFADGGEILYLSDGASGYLEAYIT